MPYIAPEPELSDQVHELATSSVAEGILVEYKGMEWSPVPSTNADISVLKSASLILFEKSTMPVSFPCTEPDLSPNTVLLMSLMFLLCLQLSPPLPVLKNSACSVLTKEAIPEMPPLSVSAKKAIPEKSACPILASKAVS